MKYYNIASTQFIYCFLFSTLLFLLNACSDSNPTKTINQPTTPFFDLQGFFNTEISQLQEKNPSVRKKVTINGKSEEKQLEDLDFQQELKVFSNSDINKIAWFDKYKIDSTLQREKLQSISYTALDEELKIRKIELKFTDTEKIEQIEIQSKTESFVANASQHLIYQPSKGYSIHSVQGMQLGDEQDIKVEIQFQ